MALWMLGEHQQRGIVLGKTVGVRHHRGTDQPVAFSART
jgi:hypothetical protein